MVERKHDFDTKNKPSNQLDVFGTPLPVKTPINFAQRLESAGKNNAAAMRKLMTVSFVSVFFITA